jgi:hypothetical protein
MSQPKHAAAKPLMLMFAPLRGAKARVDCVERLFTPLRDANRSFDQTNLPG